MLLQHFGGLCRQVLYCMSHILAISLFTAAMNESSMTKPLSAPCGHPGHLSCHVAFWIWRTVPFVLLALGTVGNLLNLAVLTRKRMRQNRSSLYLTCLAIADLVFLWTSAVRNMLLRVKYVDIKSLSIFNCKVTEWLAVWGIFSSIWLLVLLTTERFLFTVTPLFARRCVKKSHYTVSVVIVVIVTCLNGCHFLIGNTLQNRTLEIADLNGVVKNTTQTVCEPSNNAYKVFLSGPWIYNLMLMYNVIPFVLILLGNGTIALVIILRKRKIHPTGPQGTTKNFTSLTKLLFFLSAVFFFTTTPYALFGIVFARYHSSLNSGDFAKFQLIHAVVFNCLYMNSTFNFILYCLSGSVFRGELKALGNEMKLKLCRLKLCRLFRRETGPIHTDGASLPSRSTGTSVLSRRNDRKSCKTIVTVIHVRPCNYGNREGHGSRETTTE